MGTSPVPSACGLGRLLPCWTCEKPPGASPVRTGVGVVNRLEEGSWHALLISQEGPSWVKVPTLCRWGPRAVVPELGPKPAALALGPVPFNPHDYNPLHSARIT